MRSGPPSVQPATRSDPTGPSAGHSLSSSLALISGSGSEGPVGSEVNGWTPGPLPLLGRRSPAGQGPAANDTRLPDPALTTHMLT